MSVYTRVTEDELAAWLKGYALGALVELKGIAAGIENTNYFVTTTRGRFVLTLFEKLTAAELPFYLRLMSHLARHGIPCPSPVADRNDALLGTLNGKPAALVTRLPGAPVMSPGAAHCALIGATLAEMHVAGRTYEPPGTRVANPRGPQWWRETAPKVEPFIDAGRRALLADELEYQSARAARHATTLPGGPIHADLFRDNALWDAASTDGSPRLGGVIDFYFAGTDAWLFDVAVTLNDWCVDAAGEVNAGRAGALLGAYAAERAFTAAEREAWPAMLRAAALRFWLSRLYDFHCPRPGDLTHAHDPEHFRRILDLRRASHPALP